MGAWWSGLTGIEQILYCIAIPATLVLILQTIMEICGFDFGGDGGDIGDLNMDGVDLDVDMVGGADASGDASVSDDISVADMGAMRFFTLQGIVAFFAIFGWSAIIALDGGCSATIGILAGTIFGLIAMYVVAKILQLSSKLTQNGTLDIRNALGETGRVYLTIPPKGEGHGKVNVMVQGTLQEFDALNNSKESIKTGESIRVVDVEGSCLIVEKE